MSHNRNRKFLLIIDKEAFMHNEAQQQESSSRY